MTYIDKRALENRLDTVCGPHGWYPEYEATQRGYKCRLHILVPMSNDSWVWMHKEDGAGFEEMGSKNTQTGEWECDVDNDEKSGYTNALRRAAQDAWGIGRYLYGKGIPAWLDPNASPRAQSSRMLPPYGRTGLECSCRVRRPADLSQQRTRMHRPTSTARSGNAGTFGRSHCSAWACSSVAARCGRTAATTWSAGSWAGSGAPDFR